MVKVWKSAVDDFVQGVDLCVRDTTGVAVNTEDLNQVTLGETVVVGVDANDLWVITEQGRVEVGTFGVGLDWDLLGYHEHPEERYSEQRWQSG